LYPLDKKIAKETAVSALFQGHERPEDGLFLVDFSVVSFGETACVPLVNLRRTPG
jgi:hypothetical protein